MTLFFFSGARGDFASSSVVPQKFRLACGRQAEPLSLTVSETSPAKAAAAILQTVRLKHTINFSIAGVTFYCATVSGLGELAASCRAAS